MRSTASRLRVVNELTLITSPILSPTRLRVASLDGSDTRVIRSLDIQDAEASIDMECLTEDTDALLSSPPLPPRPQSLLSPHGLTPAPRQTSSFAVERSSPIASDAIGSYLTLAPQPLIRTLSSPPDTLSSWILVFASEVRVLASHGAPIMLSSFLSQLLTMVEMSFVGLWTGFFSLAAAGIGAAFFNMAFIVVSAAAQAVEGSIENIVVGVSGREGDAKRAGIILQRGVFLALIVSVPAMITLGLSEPILVHLLGTNNNEEGQGTDLARNAAGYCESLILGLSPLAVGLIMTRWLWGFQIWLPGVVIAVIANCANVALNALLIDVQGFMGSPLATSLCRLFQCACLLAYVTCFLPKSTYVHRGFGLPSTTHLWDAITDMVALRRMLFHTIGYTVVFLLESLPYECSTLLAAAMGAHAVAIHTVVLYFSSFVFMSGPLGVGLAGRDRIGALLSHGWSQDARWCCMVASSCGVCFMFVSSIATLILRSSLASFFVVEETVMAGVADLALVSAVYQCIDGYQGTLACVIRGLSKKHDVLVTCIACMSWWAIGIPYILLATQVYDVGVRGIWYGMIAAIACNALVLSALVHSIDWDLLTHLSAHVYRTPGQVLTWDDVARVHTGRPLFIDTGAGGGVVEVLAQTREVEMQHEPEDKGAHAVHRTRPMPMVTGDGPPE
jgi:MATE family multidrug resistance protein